MVERSTPDRKVACSIHVRVMVFACLQLRSSTVTMATCSDAADVLPATGGWHCQIACQWSYVWLSFHAKLFAHIIRMQKHDFDSL